MKKYFLLSILLIGLVPLFFFETKAQEQQLHKSDDSSFQNEVGMKNHLKSKGIDPLATDWFTIGQLCDGFKNAENEVAYNKCRYQKAMDAALHSSDRKQCFLRSKANYPDSFTREKHTEISYKSDGEKKSGVVERIINPISEKELEDLRYGAVIECMQNLGWASADNWKLGRNCN